MYPDTPSIQLAFHAVHRAAFHSHAASLEGISTLCRHASPPSRERAHRERSLMPENSADTPRARVRRCRPLGSSRRAHRREAAPSAIEHTQKKHGGRRCRARARGVVARPSAARAPPHTEARRSSVWTCGLVFDNTAAEGGSGDEAAELPRPGRTNAIAIGPRSDAHVALGGYCLVQNAAALGLPFLASESKWNYVRPRFRRASAEPCHCQ